MAETTINIEAMTSLVSCIEAASGRLHGDKSSMQGIVNAVRVDSSPAAKLGPVAAWLESQVPGLRRRLALAIHIQEQQPGGFYGGTVAYKEADVSTLTPAQAQDLARQVAKELSDNADDPDPSLVAALGKNANDPYFAAELARTLSPEQLANVPAAMSSHQDALAGSTASSAQTLADYKKLYETTLAGLSDAISTATRGRGDLAVPPDYADKWVSLLTGDGHRPMPHAGGAAALLLGRGVYDKDFLNKVGSAVLDYETKNAEPGFWQGLSSAGGSGPRVHAPDGHPVFDPVAGLMHAMGNNADAAQTFLSPDRLKYLATERRWSDDKGDGFGNALEAATTVYRDRTPDTPTGEHSRGYRSAEIASQVLKLMGDKEGTKVGGGLFGIGADDWHMADGIKDSVGRILAGYVPDLFRVGGSKTDVVREGAWVFSGREDGLPSSAPYGAMLDKPGIEKLLQSMGTDKDAIGEVTAAALQLQKTAMSYTLEQARKEDPHAVQDFLDGKTVSLMDDAGDRSARVMGWMLRHAIEGENLDRSQKKAQREQVIGLLESAADLVPVPGGKLVDYAVGQGKSALFDKFKAAGTSSSWSQGKPEEALAALERNSYNSFIAAGYLDPDVAKGMAPPDSITVRDSAAKGLRLKTDEELEASGATADYQNWYNNHAPKIWVDGRLLPRYAAEYPEVFGNAGDD